MVGSLLLFYIFHLAAVVALPLRPHTQTDSITSALQLQKSWISQDTTKRIFLLGSPIPFCIHDTIGNSDGTVNCVITRCKEVHGLDKSMQKRISSKMERVEPEAEVMCVFWGRRKDEKEDATVFVEDRESVRICWREYAVSREHKGRLSKALRWCMRRVVGGLKVLGWLTAYGL